MTTSSNSTSRVTRLLLAVLAIKNPWLNPEMFTISDYRRGWDDAVQAAAEVIKQERDTND